MFSFLKKKYLFFCFKWIIYVHVNVMSWTCPTHVSYHKKCKYGHIMFKKCQEYIKIMFILDQEQNIKFWDDENITFYYLLHF